MGSVNCGTNGVFNGEVVNCDANASLQLGELTLSDVGNRGANGHFTFCKGKFDFKMLLSFLVAVCLFIIRCFFESRIFEIVATTKCSSYVHIFLALANRFLEM